MAWTATLDESTGLIGACADPVGPLVADLADTGQLQTVGADTRDSPQGSAYDTGRGREIGGAGVNRLVGREGELAALLGALDGLGPRRASWVQVTGEPGIGKTRLVTEFCRVAESRGALALVGRAAELERDVPFGVVIDAFDDYLGSHCEARLSELCDRRGGQLHRIFPALSGLGPSQLPGSGDERYPAYRALRVLVERVAIPGPLIVVLDDLQWADVASIELLSFLLQRPPEAPVLMVAMWRPGQIPALDSTLSFSARDLPGIALDLAALAEEEVRELLGGVLEAPRLAAVCRASGGNPFYALALAAAAVRGSPLGPRSGEEADDVAIPACVAVAIDHEIESLSRPARLLAQGAAVLGEPFEPELAARCANLVEDDMLPGVDELVASRIVQSAQSPRRFAFRHPIVRRAIHDSAAPGWRLGAHSRAAAVLIERGAPIVTVAHHVARSAAVGDLAAAELLIAAAAEAVAAAPASAAGWLEAAVSIVPHRPDTIGTRLDLLSARARVCCLLGQLQIAHDALCEALGLVAAGDAMHMQLVAATAGVEHGLGRFADARSRLVAALGELSDAEAATEAAVCVELAVSWLYTLDFEEASGWATRALCASAGVDRLLEGTARALLAFVHASTELPEELGVARGHRAEAATILDSLSDERVATRLDALFYLGWAERLLEDYGRSAAHLGRAIAVAKAAGTSQWLIPTIVEHAKVLALCGQVVQAREAAETAVGMARVSGAGLLVLLAITAEVAVLSAAGDIDAAVAAAAEALCLCSQGAGYHAGIVHRYLALAYLEVGEAERFGAELDQVDAADNAVVGDGMRFRVLEARCRAELKLGHRDAAQMLSEEAGEAAPAGLPASTGFVRRASARVLSLAHPDDALGVARDAAALFEQAGAHLEAARTKVLVGEILASCGRAQEAVAELLAARDALGACGAYRSAEDVGRTLRRVRRARRRPPSQGATASSAWRLSRREREIAELVAEGLTNHQIALRLSISDNTVESHLGSILAKLDVNGRGAVARALSRQSDPG